MRGAKFEILLQHDRLFLLLEQTHTAWKCQKSYESRILALFVCFIAVKSLLVKQTLFLAYVTLEIKTTWGHFLRFCIFI